MSHRKEICKIISEMLDNPDKSGIFQTTKAFDALEELINKAKVEAIGWMYAEACANADDGIDIRKIEVPSLIVRAKEDLIITK